jgi:hypothetical protein
MKKEEIDDASNSILPFGKLIVALFLLRLMDDTALFKLLHRAPYVDHDKDKLALKLL